MTEAQRPERLTLQALIPMNQALSAFQLAEGQSLYTPIGGIYFRDKAQLMILAEDQEGQIRSQILPQSESSPILEPENNRILQLSEMNDLIVAQVGIQAESIRTYPSIRQRSTVSVNFDYTDPETGQKGKYTTNEETLLRVFTGEEGGIAVFDGGDLKEEVALVLTKKHQDKKAALLLFIHDAEASPFIDSVSGFNSFLDRLVTEFRNNAAIPEQEKALDQYENLSKKGRIRFESKVRENIFRMMIVANARLGSGAGASDRYSDFLKKFLPAENFFSRPNAATLEKRSAEIEESIDSLIVSSHPQIKSDAKQEKATQEPEVLKLLTSSDLRVIRKEVIPHYGIDTAEMRGYINVLADYINCIPGTKPYEAKSDLIRNIEFLLSELSASEYSRRAIDYDFSIYRSNGEKILFYNAPGSYTSNRLDPKLTWGSSLIKELISVFNSYKNR